MWRTIVFSIFLFLLTISQVAQGQESPQLKPPDTLLIGFKESPPFVYRDAEGRLTGISIWLWEHLAEESGYAYEYRELSLEGILEGLRSGSISLSVNPLTVTSQRIEEIEFTQPFFVSSSAIATQKKSELSVGMAFLKRFFSINFLKAVLVLFLVIFIFGFATWLFERHKNPEEFPAGWRGLWEGIWWSAVTMTTVGYGDKSPRSVGGRFIGLIWMFTAIIIISGLTAGIASSLTISQMGSDIESLDGLRPIKSGTVAASASESFLKDNFIRPRPFKKLEGGLEALHRGEIGAFVYDEPILRYSILQDSLADAIQVLPYRFNTQYYSFGFPKSSPLPGQLNPGLLRIIESNSWKVVLSEYELHEL